MKRWQQGKAIYGELCFACHGADGKGMPLQGGLPGETIAPPLRGSRTVRGYRDGIVSVVLKGLTGPVNGKAYTAVMVPMESNNDDWIAAVTSFVRSSFGGHASLVSPQEVAAVRARLGDHVQPWTEEELQATLPQPLTNRRAWKLAASHHPESVALAVDGKPRTRYDTGTTQVPGMWFQIELPQPANICCLQMDAGNDVHDYPRGYKVELSDDGRNWSGAVAEGKGRGRFTEINFAPADARFVRVIQTGTAARYFWSIHELRILESPQIKLTAPSSVAKTGIAMFSFGDISNLGSFADRLKRPAQQDEISKYVYSQLSPATLKVLAGYTAGPNPQLQSALVDELNRLIQSGPLYESRRFAGVSLSKETSRLVVGNKPGQASPTANAKRATEEGAKFTPAMVFRLNRQLLMEAFPRELASRQNATGFE